MKANSRGLEVDIEITREELARLGEHTRLSCGMKFTEYHENPEQGTIIPISLDYNRKYQGAVECKVVPKGTYFGSAKQIEFTIGDYLFEPLRENGETGERITRLWPDGKILIRVGS